MNSEHMNSDLRDAALATVHQAGEPVSVKQIRTAVSRMMKTGGSKGPAADFDQELPRIFGESEGSDIYEWPKFRGVRMYWKRSFRSCVEEAVMKALERDPLTAVKAAKAVSKNLKRVSEQQAAAELKTLLRALTESKQVFQFAANRQSVLYVSSPYLQRLLPAREPESFVADVVLSVVERLQSGPGNYVRIDHLRNSPELRGPVDAAAIALTEKGKLVLARYDGPRPLPDEEKWNYIEDARGDLFVGVAVPRGERVTV